MGGEGSDAHSDHSVPSGGDSCSDRLGRKAIESVNAFEMAVVERKA